MVDGLGREAIVAIYLDDAQLVAAHKAGDSEAFDELVSEHRAPLLAQARRKLFSDEAAEDALQETLIRAYRALPRFNGEYKLGPWLHRIMSNVCIDEINRRRRDGERFEKAAAQPSARTSSPGVEEELGLDIDDTNLTTALDDLPESYREALELRFIDELEYKEVASTVGVSEENARARVSRAKTSMRNALKGVAALPIFLAGLLRRGEKAAAAATSTTGAAVTGSGITKAGLVAQAAPAASNALPAVSEAVSTVGPVAVPAIAKAAVGIGIAAAVLTPNADGALHHVVQSVATDPGASLLLGSEDAEVDEITDAQLSSVEMVSETQGGSSAEVGQSDGSVSTAADIQTSSVVFGSSELSIEQAGAGRMRLQGAASFSWLDGQMNGTLGAASQIRMSTDLEDSEGRQRLDGLLVLEAEEAAEPIEIRIAGFATATDDTVRFTGVYRLNSSLETQVGTEGQIEGEIQLPNQQINGSLELTLKR